MTWTANELTGLYRVKVVTERNFQTNYKHITPYSTNVLNELFYLNTYCSIVKYIELPEAVIECYVEDLQTLFFKKRLCLGEVFFKVNVHTSKSQAFQDTCGRVLV